MYLNSGDWIENLTALEYSFGNWEIIHHQPQKKIKESNDDVNLPQQKELMELVINSII